MIQTNDFSAWEEYKGSSEGSGRSEKIWLCSSDKKVIGLFKYPKSNQTTEHISEKLAAEIAYIVGLPCAKIDVGYKDDRIGSMSYLIRNKGELLLEGIYFIAAKYPDFDSSHLVCKNSGQYYSLEMIMNSIRVFDKRISTELKKQLFNVFIFDALIGNTDRHQSNWAILFPKNINDVHVCPIYDNGSSLCCYVRDDQIPEILGKDKNRFNALVRTRSTSRVRINCSIKKEPTHEDVVSYIRDNYYAETNQFVEQLLTVLEPGIILATINKFPNTLLSPLKKDLIFRFLTEKVNIIKQIYNRGVNSVG